MVRTGARVRTAAEKAEVAGILDLLLGVPGIVRGVAIPSAEPPAPSPMSDPDLARILDVYGDEQIEADDWGGGQVFGFGTYGAGYAFGGYGVARPGSAKAFVKEAQRWVDRVESATESIPFWGYQSGYRDMTAAQLRWYFAWRVAVRNGRYPKTDSGYVHLLIYEVINGVGVADAAAGLAMLTALDHAYGRRLHMSYLFDTWLEDFAFVNGMGDAFAAVRHARGLAEKGPHFSNWAIKARGEGPLSAMPLGMIAQVGEVSLEASRFYQDGNDLLLEHFVPRALEAVDLALRGTGTRGVFARYAPRAPKPWTRQAFPHALYAGKRVKVKVAQAPQYANGTRLIKLTKGVVKHTENRLRAASGVKSRLRSFEIAPEHAALIDELVTRELPAFAREHGGRPGAMALPAPIVVTVDVGRVGRLRAESEEVRGMLIEAMGAVDPAEVAAASPAVATSNLDDGVDVTTDPGTSADGVLTDAQRAALAAVMAGVDVDRALRTIAARAGLMPEALLDQVNEAAIERIGDAVVDVSGPTPVIYDEYVDDVAAWVAR